MNEDSQSTDFQRRLTRARSGDPEALGELLNLHRNYLLLIANQDIDPQIRGKLGSSDVVQESLLTAHQHFDQFRGDSKNEFLAWLRQILINDLNQNRRKFKGTQKRQVNREQSLQETSTFFYPLVDPMETPRTTALAAEEAEILRAAMEELPEDYERVIRLHNWEQIEFDEVAERMGRSPDAVRKLWTRAVLKLQKLVLKEKKSE